MQSVSGKWRVAGFVLLVLLLGMSGCQSAQSILEKGEALRKEGKLEEAEIQIRRSLQKDANSVDANLALAEVLREQGKAADALAAYIKVYDTARDNKAVQEKVADTLLNSFVRARGKSKFLYEQLKRIGNDMRAKDSNSFQARRIEGILALADRDAERALSSFEAANRAKPGQEEIQLGLVEALFGVGRGAEAEKLAEELIAKNPQSEAPYRRLYQIYVDTKRLDMATKVLEREMAANPKHLSAALFLAKHIAERLGDEEAAEKMLRGIAASSDYPNGALEAARIYQQSGNHAMVVQLLSDAVGRKQGPLLDMRKMLSEAYLFTGRIQEAFQQLRQAGLENPGDKSINMAEAILSLEGGTRESSEKALLILDRLKEENYEDRQLDFHRARALMAVQRVEEGVKLMQEFAARQRRHVESRLLLAVYFAGREKWNDALRYIDEILEQNPSEVRATEIKLLLLRKSGRLEEARNLLQQAKRDQPNNRRILQEEGIQALEMKRYDAAAEAFGQLYQKGERGIPLVTGLSQAYLGQKKVAQALSLLDTEINRRPEDRGLRAVRGDIYAQTGDLSKAVAEYEKLARDPSSDAILFRNLARYLASAGDHKRASEVYAKMAAAQRANPTDYAFWLQAAMTLSDGPQIKQVCDRLSSAIAQDWTLANNCAYALADVGIDLERAEQLARENMKVQQKEPGVRDTLGWVLVKRGKFDEALPLFTSLSTEFPANPTYRYHRALTLSKLNRKGEAVLDLQTARKSRPGPQLAAKIEALGKELGR